MSNLPSITYSSMEKAGMPAPLKSQMRAWIDRTIAAGGQTPESVRSIAKLHAVAFGEGVRMTGEAVIYGSILGAAHALLPNGLDLNVPGTKVNVPLDAVAAVLGIVAGTFAAQEPYGIGKTLAQGGASCAAVFGFRKTSDMITELNIRRSGATPGGGAVIPGKIGKAATFNGEGDSERRGGIIGHPTSRLGNLAKAALSL